MHAKFADMASFVRFCGRETKFLQRRIVRVFLAS